MRYALVICGCSLLMAVGCSRAPAPVAAVPVAAAPAAPQVPFRPAPFLNEAVSTGPVEDTVITWEAVLVQFHVADTERHGLKSLFESAGQKNPVMEREQARSVLVQMARANTNIQLHLAASAYAARLTFEESTNLLDYFHATAGVDVLSPPQIMARGTNEVQMQVSDKITLVLGSLDPSDPAAILTTNIGVGPTLTMQLLARNGSNLTIEASGRLEEFHGYAEKTEVPRPKFSVSAMGTRAELNTNEVLVLGGPMQMNVVKTVDRMAYLSDIPAIGKLFTKVQVRTNFVRTMVILRPRVL